MAEIFTLSLFPFMVASAAIGDFLTMRIPNWLNAVIAGSFFVMAFAQGMPLEMIGWHLAAFAVALVIGFALFAFGYIGGGDAKMVAAAALWIGWDMLLPFLVIMSLAGGLLAVAMKFWWWLSVENALRAPGWLGRFFKTSIDLPYGVAVAVGAIWVFPETWWVKAAAAAGLA